MKRTLSTAVYCIILTIESCATPGQREDKISRYVSDQIAVCGRLYATGVKVVRWDEPGGFDGYMETCFFDHSRVLPHKPAKGCDTARRYSVRACLVNETDPVDDDLAWLSVREAVRQIIVHYDASGTSRRCFNVLHDQRGLSSHFLLDTDGTIYQTLDVRVRARHAGSANDVSVGVEIANVGAYDTLADLEKAASLHGALSEDRGAVHTGVIQGRSIYQYGFTDAQYVSLIHLIRTLRRALPNIGSNTPRQSDGMVAVKVCPEEQQHTFSGILGHYHVSAAKVDPGPAFDWTRVLSGVEQGERSQPSGSPMNP